MTSKEFFRRCEYFKSLESASRLFSFKFFPDASDSDFIFRCTIVTSSSSRYSFFCSKSDFFHFSSFDDVCLFYADVFTRLDFDVQFRYFVSFFNRCSKFQRQLFIESGNYDSLLSRFHGLYDKSRPLLSL